MTLLRKIILSLLILAPIALAQSPDPQIFTDAVIDHYGADVASECPASIVGPAEACVVAPSDVDVDELQEIATATAEAAGLEHRIPWVPIEEEYVTHMAGFGDGAGGEQLYIAMITPPLTSMGLGVALAISIDEDLEPTAGGDASTPTPGQIRDMIATRIDDAVVTACPAGTRGGACFRVFGDGELARMQVDSAARYLGAEAVSPWRERGGVILRQYDLDGAGRFTVGVEPGYDGDQYQALVWIEN